jgi:protein-S-isoprenylcysteine O-methyltransferase Ste14
MSLFKILYWAAMLIEIVVRAPFQKTAKTGAKIDQRGSPTENLLLVLLTVVMLVIPLIYSVINWLDFANYHLPVWMGWSGVFLLACSVFIFRRAHLDLKSNWSPTLETRKDHTLVTNGIYGYIRHPMYASQCLWAIAQILLLQNWLAGPLHLIFFVPFYILRVQAEEKMMLDTFGDRYREYMKKTGGVIPKF